MITLASLTFLFVLFAFAFSKLPVRFGGESLPADQENLRTLLDTADESVMLLACDGLLLEINETGMRRFGKSRHELIGQNLLDILPQERAERRRTALAEVCSTRLPISGEDWLEGRCLAWRLHPVLKGNAPVQRIWLFAKDVTGERQLQAITKVFQQFDQRLLRHQANLRQLAGHLCQELVPLFALEAVWIARQESHGELKLLAGAGSTVFTLADQLLEGRSFVHEAISRAEPVILRPDNPEWTQLPAALQAAASTMLVALPIYVTNAVLGVLVLHGPAQNGASLLALFENIAIIANHVSLAFEAAYDQSRLRLYEKALASTGTAVFITDREGHINWVNEAFVRTTGFQRHELIGHQPRDFSSGIHDPAFFEDMWQTLRSGQVWRADIVNRRKDGSLYFARQIISPLAGDDGEIAYYVSLLEDITDQKLHEEKLAHLASHDTLTGLPNRRHFEQALPRHLALANRNQQNCHLMFVDLDGFKPINDTYGHDNGDQVLKEIAGRLENTVRMSDTVARFGGDEFVIILPNVHDRPAAEGIAQKVLAACRDPIPIGQSELQLGASIGLAMYPDDAQDPQVLLKLADDAMYMAKMSGRNTYRFHGG